MQWLRLFLTTHRKRNDHNRIRQQIAWVDSCPNGEGTSPSTIKSVVKTLLPSFLVCPTRSTTLDSGRPLATVNIANYRSSTSHRCGSILSHFGQEINSTSWRTPCDHRNSVKKCDKYEPWQLVFSHEMGGSASDSTLTCTLRTMHELRKNSTKPPAHDHFHHKSRRGDSQKHACSE